MEKINCFSHGTVIYGLASHDKFQAIHELIYKAPVFKDLERIDYLEKAVLQRERIQSTGLGRGVAVAHGKAPSGERIVIALGISREGIDFESTDGLPVHFLFVIANPPGMQPEYLLALSILARIIRDDQFRKELLKCEDSFEVETMLSKAFREWMLKRGLP